MKKQKQAIPLPTEAQEQQAVMQWAEIQKGEYPELALLHHIPNGGSRHTIEAVHLKAQGVKRGVPDLHLPVARGGYHGLFIEMKRRAGGRLSPEQKLWAYALTKEGNRVEVCKGCDEAIQAITSYLCDGKGETVHAR